MKLDIDVENKIEEIEKIICSHFGVTGQQIINKERTEDVISARAFLFYILHYKLEMSPLTISKIYPRQPRGIKKLCAKIKNGLKFHKVYTSIYEDLLKKIEPILPKDLDKFWNREKLWQLYTTLH